MLAGATGFVVTYMRRDKKGLFVLERPKPRHCLVGFCPHVPNRFRVSTLLKVLSSGASLHGRSSKREMCESTMGRLIKGFAETAQFCHFASERGMRSNQSCRKFKFFPDLFCTCSYSSCLGWSRHSETKDSKTTQDCIQKSLRHDSGEA